MYFTYETSTIYRNAAKRAYANLKKKPTAVDSNAAAVRIPSQDKQWPALTIPTENLGAAFLSHHFCTHTTTRRSTRAASYDDCLLCFADIDANALAYDDALGSDVGLCCNCKDYLFKNPGPAKFAVCCGCGGIKKLVLVAGEPAVLEIFDCIHTIPTPGGSDDITKSRRGKKTGGGSKKSATKKEVVVKVEEVKEIINLQPINTSANDIVMSTAEEVPPAPVVQTSETAPSAPPTEDAAMTTDSEELSNGKKRKRDDEEASEPELESQPKRIKLEESPDGEEEVTDSVATTESRPEKANGGEEVASVKAEETEMEMIQLVLASEGQQQQESPQSTIATDTTTSLSSSTVPEIPMTSDAMALLSTALANLQVPHMDLPPIVPSAPEACPSPIVVTNQLPVASKPVPANPLDILLPGVELSSPPEQPRPQATRLLNPLPPPQPRQATGIHPSLLAPSNVPAVANTATAGKRFDYEQVHADRRMGRQRPIDEYKSMGSSIPTPQPINDYAEEFKDLERLRALEKKYTECVSEFSKLTQLQERLATDHATLSRWREELNANQTSLSDGFTALVKEKMAISDSAQRLADEKIAYADQLKRDKAAHAKMYREMDASKERERKTNNESHQAARDRDRAIEERKAATRKLEEAVAEQKAATDIATQTLTRKNEIAKILAENIATEKSIIAETEKHKQTISDLKFYETKHDATVAQWDQSLASDKRELSEIRDELVRLRETVEHETQELDRKRAAYKAKKAERNAERDAKKKRNEEIRRKRAEKQGHHQPAAFAALPIEEEFVGRSDDDDDNDNPDSIQAAYDNLDM